MKMITNDADDDDAVAVISFIRRCVPWATPAPLDVDEEEGG